LQGFVKKVVKKKKCLVLKVKYYRFRPLLTSRNAPTTHRRICRVSSGRAVVTIFVVWCICRG
jgi:hypothetical protein